MRQSFLQSSYVPTQDNNVKFIELEDLRKLKEDKDGIGLKKEEYNKLVKDMLQNKISKKK
jgi:hypothetical protein